LNEPKVLIGTPIYDQKDYALEKQLLHINKLDYTNFDQVFFENSKSDKYYSKLKRKGLKVVRVPRGQNSRSALANSMNFMRHYAMDNGYEYVLVLENDLFPDPQIIKRLLKHDKKVVGSYYFLGLDKDEETFQLAIKDYKNLLITDKELGKRIKGLFFKHACIFVIDRKPDSGFKGTRCLTRKEGFEMFNTGLQRVHGIGLGAVLIKIEIIRRFPYYYDSRFDNKHPDVYFYADLEDANVPVWIDTSIVIPHEPTDWTKVKDR